MKKAVFSFIAALSIIFCFPIVANAYFDKTENDAVSWVLGHSEGVGYEYDGAVDKYINDELWIMTNQCVDLIRGYMDYISETHASGNAGTYTDNDLPEGYYRIQKYNGFVPLKGDILIWEGNPGHVAICTAVNSQWEIVYSDQNGAGSYKKVKHNRTMNPSDNDYWGVIRPEFRPLTYAAPTVHVSPVGVEVDISWNDVRASSYYIYIQNKDNQSIPYSNNVDKACSIHLGLTEGNFVAYVTAVYSSDNMKTVSADFSLAPFAAPTVCASPIGTEVDISWTDVGANSYYIYVQNEDNQSIPYGNNVGRQFSVHLGLTEGNFSAYVTAVYSSDNMKTGSANFTTRKLCATVDKGQDGLYSLNEPVLISLNADTNTFDSSVLRIYRTPTGGDTYLYWEGLVYSSSYSTSFSNEGYYSCNFTLARNGNTVYSEWIGWSVQLIKYTVSYNANGGKNPPDFQQKGYGENITLSFEQPTRADHIFLGWATSADAKMAQHQPGDTYSVDADLTLYAVWEPVTFTLPASLTTIEDEAFAGIKDCVVRLPDGVSYVSPSAFDSSVRLLVKAGTSAAEAVKDLGLTVIEE